jgi:hypothetical protein
MKPNPIFSYIICGLIFLFFWACGATRAPLADEIDFLKPLQLWISDGPKVQGLWHAPFYPWILMYLGRLNSQGAIWVPRLLGALSLLVALWFMIKASTISRPVMKPSDRFLWLLTTVLAPATIGSSLILDYDTTFLIASTSAYFFYLIKEEPKPNWKYVMKLGSLIGLCLMSKETTPLIYPIGIFLRVTHSSGIVRGFLTSVFSLLLAIALFLATTAVWCKIYGIHMARVFDMDLLGLKIHSNVASAVSQNANATQLFTTNSWRAIWVAITPWLWLGPVSIFLLGDAFHAPKRLWQERNGPFSVGITVVSIIFVYTFLLSQKTYHFPKYMAPVLPWILWLGFHMRGAAGAPAAARIPGVMIYALFTAGWFMLAPNPLMVLYARDAAGMITYLLIWGIPFGLIYMVRPRPAALLVLALTGNIGHLRDMVLTNRSVTYWYGETTLADVEHALAPWLSQKGNALIYSPAKDIAWALRNRGAEYEPRDLLASRAQTICDSQMPHIIISRHREDSSLSRSPELNTLKSCLKEVVTKGDLVIGANFKYSPNRP